MAETPKPIGDGHAFARSIPGHLATPERRCAHLQEHLGQLILHVKGLAEVVKIQQATIEIMSSRIDVLAELRKGRADG